jgi:sugar (pentulose or hexulose) kinase
VGNYLAFDLGAESCRAVVGNLDDGNKLQIKLLHRSPNGMINVRGNLHWDILGIYHEMLTGIRTCVALCGGNTESIGIDTWGVDFGLFDEKGMMIGNPIAYRDRKRMLVMDEVLAKIPARKLYELTGIQIGYVNSIFQLYAFARENNPQLKIAKDLLFIPDIFNYFFTGNKATEFSFATTSQLYNTRTNSWEKEIFTKLGVSRGIMQKVVPHGTVIGKVNTEMCGETGLGEIPVIAVGSHDTASAVAACPLPGDNAAYISSGTWSLMGIESKQPIINDNAFKYNITNEGGICGTFRVLKNLTGLWLLQEYHRQEEKAQEYTYAELSNIGINTASIRSVIDPDATQFIKPGSMSGAIADYCRSNGQHVPQSIGEFVRIILESLALAYRHTLCLLEEISGRKITQINIVGGGSQNQALCQFTADVTGLPVYAGPVEATAIGNILVQAMAQGKIKSQKELREIVKNSFPLASYEPHHTPYWDDMYDHFLKIKG